MIVNLNDPDDLACLALSPTSNINRPPAGIGVRRPRCVRLATSTLAELRYPYVAATFFSMPCVPKEEIRSLMSFCANEPRFTWENPEDS